MILPVPVFYYFCLYPMERGNSGNLRTLESKAGHIWKSMGTEIF